MGKIKKSVTPTQTKKKTLPRIAFAELPYHVEVDRGHLFCDLQGECDWATIALGDVYIHNGEKFIPLPFGMDVMFSPFWVRSPFIVLKYTIDRTSLPSEGTSRYVVYSTLGRYIQYWTIGKDQVIHDAIKYHKKVCGKLGLVLSKEKLPGNASASRG